MGDQGQDSGQIWPSVDVAGVSIHCVNFANTLQQITTWVAVHRATQGDTRSADVDEANPAICRQISTVNPEFIVDAYRDPNFADTLAQVDLRVPDGIGVLWAANRSGASLHERVTGSDGIDHICREAAVNGWRVFFLGAAPGVAEQAAVRLRARYPSLIVCGAYSGSPDTEDWPAIDNYLSATSPDILFVAYGHPRQDIWIREHIHDLPAAVAIGVGGAFDFVAGVTRRAPLWMQRLGIEWLHRLLNEPWRWRRIMKLPVYVGLVVGEKGKQTVNCE